MHRLAGPRQRQPKPLNTDVGACRFAFPDNPENPVARKRQLIGTCIKIIPTWKTYKA
jgi:hypothetical protein